jgi:predicted RNase H-like HicB family nuclease
MLKYLVVVEEAESNYSAYAPDVPGCITTGKTIEETLNNMKEALQLHLEVTLEDGASLPQPFSVHAGFVDIDLPAKIAAQP